MEKENVIASFKDLNSRILELEMLEERQTVFLKDQLAITLHSLRPSSLVRSAVGDIVSSPAIQKNILDTSLSMGAGWVAKKIVGFNSPGIFRKLAGFIIQKAVTKIAAKKISRLRHHEG